MKHLDLFSGIGGFALATEMVWDDVEHIFCDNEPFSQAVLKKHWPNAQIYGDIKTLHPGPADLVTGGFPCQPFSSAGKRRGTEDDRHLWPHMLRVIRESAPRWVIGENVGGLITWNEGMVFDQVCTDLEAEGYQVWPFIIPAVAVNAPHRRDRIWIIANRSCARLQGDQLSKALGKETGTSRPAAELYSHAADTAGRRRGQRIPERQKAQDLGVRSSRAQWSEDWTKAAARLCTMDDGLPGGVARPRGWRNASLKGAGNAIVPQVAAEIFKAIREIDDPNKTYSRSTERSH